MKNQSSEFDTWLSEHNLDGGERLLINGPGLKSKRESQGFSQAELADKAGLDQARISDLETGKIEDVSTERGFLLTRSLKCPLKEITRDADQWLPIEDYQRITPKIEKLADVPTLLSSSKGAGWSNLYFPTTVISANGEVKDVADLDVLGDGPAMILGVAGQGKSMFLRHLVLETFASKGRRILPVFLELQSLKGRTIKDATAEYLKKQPFAFNSKKVEGLFRTGRIALFLDGLDEVLQEHRGDIASELETLYSDFPNLRLIVSTRPHMGTETLTCFNEFQIKGLDDTSIMDLVRIYASPEDAQEISSRLSYVSREIKSILSTPLMVVLFVIHFGAKKTVPATMIALYKDLPDLLINKHKRSIKGPLRPIKSGLDPVELRKFFSALCYYAMDSKQYEDVLGYDIEKIAADAMSSLGYGASARDALDDVIEITNLILQNGRYYRFAHRTIKEFYAASFVADELSDVKSFYKRMLVEWKDWSGVLCFLETIDRLRCIEYFLIPNLSRLSPFTFEAYLASHTTLELRYPAFVHPESSKYVSATLEDHNIYGVIGGIGSVIRLSDLSRYVPTDLIDTVKEQLFAGGPVKIYRRISLDNQAMPQWDFQPWTTVYRQEALSPHYTKSKFEALQAELQMAKSSQC